MLIPLGVALVIKLIPKEVMDDCRSQARMALEGKRPVSRVAAGIIIAPWIVIAASGILFLRRAWGV